MWPPFLVFLLITIISAPPIPGFPLHLVSSTRRKTVVAAQIELLHFVDHFGLEKCAFLTLRVPNGRTLKQAQVSFNNAARRFFKEFFPAWITMVEFTRYDQPHFHLLVATRHDCRSGFNFTNYNRMKEITNRAYREHRALTVAEKRERGLLAHNLTTDPKLKALWKRLRNELPHFGFSNERPAELVPIQKNATAIAFYLTEQFLSPLLVSYIPRGARLLRCSAGYPRVIPRIADLVIDTPGRRRYMVRRQHILGLLGCADTADMRVHYGRRWGWLCHQTDQALVDRYGQCSIPWNSPEVQALAEEVMANGYVWHERGDEWEICKPL